MDGVTIATKMLRSPLTKKICKIVAGAAASYVTQILVGKAYDSIIDVDLTNDFETLKS